jgi:prophage antirepressor-like protein
VLLDGEWKRTCRFCGARWLEIITTARFVDMRSDHEIDELRIPGVRQVTASISLPRSPEKTVATHTPVEPTQTSQSKIEDEKEAIEVSKSKALQVFTFNDRQVRVVMKDNRPWWVVKDVCDVLELTNPTEAIKPLDDDEKMTLRISEGHSGKRGGAQMQNVVNESGVYALIIRSNKPEAKKFRKWITSEVLPAIRKTGEYATPEAQRRKTDKSDELAWKRLGVMERNADYRMAKLILQGIDKFKDVMTPESKTVFMAKYGELTTKHDMTHMLPPATEKWYTATDLAKEYGSTAQKIGLVSNENNLKAPEGQSNEYGTWIRSKSPHSSKEVVAWVYYEAGRAWFAEYFSKQVKTA